MFFIYIYFLIQYSINTCLSLLTENNMKIQALSLALIVKVACAIVPDPWMIDNSTIDFTDNLIHVFHDLGLGPNNATVELFESDCQTPLASGSAISLVSTSLTPNLPVAPSAAPSMNTVIETLSPACSPTNLCGKCQGDCDNDGECMGNLVCYNRGSSSSPQPPGCTGTTSGANDYCIDPNELYFGGGSYCSNTFPCGRCQGDCDVNSHCAGSLVCAQRHTSDPGPAGCEGTPVAEWDYCIEP